MTTDNFADNRSTDERKKWLVYSVENTYGGPTGAYGLVLDTVREYTKRLEELDLAVKSNYNPLYRSDYYTPFGIFNHMLQDNVYANRELMSKGRVLKIAESIGIKRPKSIRTRPNKAILLKEEGEKRSAVEWISKTLLEGKTLYVKPIGGLRRAQWERVYSCAGSGRRVAIASVKRKRLHIFFSNIDATVVSPKRKASSGVFDLPPWMDKAIVIWKKTGKDSETINPARIKVRIKDKTDLKNKLLQLFETDLFMEKLSIEHEINRPLYKGKYYWEIRLINQSPEGVPGVTAHYAKVSEEPIGNIATGGHGEKTEDVIRCLFLQQGLDEREAGKKAAKFIEEMVRQSNLLVGAVNKDLEKRREKYLPGFPENKLMAENFVTDFTAEINKETGAFEPVLIEAQNNFAMSGLADVDKEAYERVFENIKKINERGIKTCSPFFDNRKKLKEK